MNWAAILVILGAMALVGCDPEQQSADQTQKEATDKITAQADMEIGMPGISHFREKRMLKMLYELRDREVATWTYIVDLQGHTHLLCQSVGYGIPYATQYTNPMKAVWGEHGNFTIPQPEPNGLFLPASGEGTWVMCIAAGSKDARPVYAEPRVIVSPFALEMP